MVQLIKGREPLLEMGLPQIFAQAMALGYQKAYQEQEAQKQREFQAQQAQGQRQALISRMLMQEQIKREREATKPTKLDYYDPGDILTQARGQYSMYVPLNEYGETVQGLTDSGYRMGTMKEPGLPTIGTTRSIIQGPQTVQQEFTGQEWQPIGGGPRFKPSGKTAINKTEYITATNELTNIAKQKANLKKNNNIATAFLVAFNPEYKEGQEISEEDEKRLLERWNYKIKYFNQFLPEKERMQPFTVSEEGISVGFPEGLTEKDIQYNMEKYGKTRQEVIDAYNRKFGNIK